VTGLFPTSPRTPSVPKYFVMSERYLNESEKTIVGRDEYQGIF
jgi:hypothetical protein